MPKFPWQNRATRTSTTPNVKVYKPTNEKDLPDITTKSPSGTISFLDRLNCLHSRSEKEQTDLDADFTLLSLTNDGTKPPHGPIHLERPFDCKRWVLNSGRIIVYRQDNRELEEIKTAGGFHPRNLRLDTFESHMLKSSGYSYVSTSNVRLKPKSYGRYEYAILLEPGQAINTHKTLYNIHGIMSNPPRIIEYAVPGSISLAQIIGWKQS